MTTDEIIDAMQTALVYLEDGARETALARLGEIVQKTATIDQLMRLVRQHPDYVFGTVFVHADFIGDVETIDRETAIERLVEAGFDYVALVHPEVRAKVDA